MDRQDTQGWIALTAGDGHALRAWQSRPAQGVPVRGAIVVLQEIFGVNAHIRALCNRLADDGWLVVAPALFDRADRAAPELGYGAGDLAQGRDLKSRIPDEEAMRDVAAAVAHASAQDLAVAVIGFCWGGTLAWLAACRLDGVCGAIAYYGTRIAAYREETPRVPVLLHFGTQDSHIPMADVHAIAARQPQVAMHLYPAGHGFNCDARAAHEPGSAELARARSNTFLQQVLAC